MSAVLPVAIGGGREFAGGEGCGRGEDLVEAETDLAVAFDVGEFWVPETEVERLAALRKRCKS